MQAEWKHRTWRALVMKPVDATETDAIRRHLQRQHLYGPDRSCKAIEAQLERTVGPGKMRRPRKTAS
jgi:putative transposase